ncbi:unnamed protein product [Linum tenue]|uniref:Cation/H+ exchanger domain-containing protein n=1 Tax=Linum tenue TaxID=586396 RepID=A0AAV0RBK7_9ROSI|nr:unnamed protein product [Linum tenue]
MAHESRGKVTVDSLTGGVINVCLNETVPTFLDTSGFWKLARPENENDPTFIHNVPYYIVQLAAIMFGTQIVAAILKPLRLPRFSVELLSGILIGQGLQTWCRIYAMPTNSLKVLDTVGHASLIFYVFLVGLEIDLFRVRHVGWEAVYTGLTGTVLPLLIGFVEFFVMAADRRYTNFFTPEFWENLDPVKLTGPIFWGVALTVTSFPDLARILSDLKILHTDIGRLALSSSIVSELTTWILLVVALTLNNGTLNPLYLLPTFAFFVASWSLVRPAVTWVLRHADETDNKFLLHFTILGGILTSSVVTEACGANSVIGAFVFGLIIPNGDMSVRLMEKFEDYIKGVLMPGFFMDNGARTSLITIFNPIYETHPLTIFLLIVLAWSTKIINTFVFSKSGGMTTREAFTLGALMNTKGVLALIVINTGRNNQGFNQLMFVVLILSTLVMSVTVMPLAKAANKSNRKPNRFKTRTVECNKLESELRVLTCIHTTRNLSGMIYLLECSNGGKQYPISVFALHLVQLTDRRATAMLIIHENNNNKRNKNSTISNSHHSIEGPGQNLTRREEESNHIIATFESLENRGASVFAQSLTVEENSSWRMVNKNLMATATCSVGILVDRGLGSKDVKTHSKSSFTVVFIGGPDDREALAFGWRMAKSPDVNLTVLRLLPTDDNHDDDDDDVDCDIEEVTVEGGGTMRSKRGEKELDNEYVNEFRFRTMHDENINYIEKRVNDGDEVITMIGRVVPSCDLYILGQSKNARRSSIMSGLSEWTECDELGVLADTLLASEFAQRSSLLVIKQHYVPGMRMWIRRNGNNNNGNNSDNNNRVPLGFSNSSVHNVSNDVEITNRPSTATMFQPQWN